MIQNIGPDPPSWALDLLGAQGSRKEVHVSTKVGQAQSASRIGTKSSPKRRSYWPTTTCPTGATNGNSGSLAEGLSTASISDQQDAKSSSDSGFQRPLFVIGNSTRERSPAR